MSQSVHLNILKGGQSALINPKQSSAVPEGFSWHFLTAKPRSAESLQSIRRIRKMLQKSFHSIRFRTEHSEGGHDERENVWRMYVNANEIAQKLAGKCALGWGNQGWAFLDEIPKGMFVPTKTLLIPQRTAEPHWSRVRGSSRIWSWFPSAGTRLVVRLDAVINCPNNQSVLAKKEKKSESEDTLIVGNIWANVTQPGCAMIGGITSKQSISSRVWMFTLLGSCKVIFIFIPRSF